VEDDPIQIMMYEAEFCNHGYETFSAKDRKRALLLAAKVKPDLIFLDLILGNDNGLRVLEKIRSNSDLKKIGVVIFSNYFKKGLEAECKRAGALDFLLKTEFLPKELAHKVKEYL